MTISLTKSELSLIEFLLQKFMDGDGAQEEEYTQWNDAEKIKAKISKALPNAKIPKSFQLKKEKVDSYGTNKTCSECHFFDSFCKKEKEICNIFGYNKDEFKSYLHEVIRRESSCTHFQFRKVFRILDFNNGLFKVEISENSQSEIQKYSISNLHLLIHKYSEDSFVNLKEFRDKIV
jgi:hypothetical protein